MDKYKAEAEKRLKGQHPDLQAKEALVRAHFASREREEFFNTAYGELLTDYFIEFLGTDPHENKKREFIYSCVLSLGDVKAKLAAYEMYGKNVASMATQQREDNDNERD